jgi:electron transfer flavoprotein alpha/beta subunit
MSASGLLGVQQVTKLDRFQSEEDPHASARRHLLAQLNDAIEYRIPVVISCEVIVRDEEADHTSLRCARSSRSTSAAV